MGGAAIALVQMVPFTAQARPAAAGDDATAGADAPEDIIVTGTRQTGIRAADSAAPVQVLDTTALAHVGQPDLTQALSQLAPSFTSQALGGDSGNLTTSARLRGLSANHVLVLVNGKRRHGTANLQVTTGPYQGGAAPDLDLIPPEAIERIEILQDGAAAQYGSDAIAGVINIILKKDRAGGVANITAGQYGVGDGETLAGTTRLALPLGGNGFLDVTVLHRFHDYSQRGGADRRVANPDGTLLPGVPAAWANIPGFPRLNPLLGDARSSLTTATINAGYDFGSVEAYAFGTYGRRLARSRQQYRLPNRVSRTANGITVFPFPNGFVPKIGLQEEDFSGTGGLRGALAGWNWDLSATYGRDKAKISTLDSANASLYTDTGFTPRDFYDGAFLASQFTGNLDLRRTVDVGLAAPLTIAFGGEYRRDVYEIRSGDEASRYKEGGQAYPGFQPTDAAVRRRHAWSGYIDAATQPLTGWTVDLAGRFEHYSDVGNTTIGKISTRYDVSPAFGLRGTASTGFRAPTLAESFYSATNVSPAYAIVQLPANSAAAALTGFSPLTPEKSTNFSGGLVWRGLPKLTITLDAYQIRIKKRIAASGLVLGRFGTFVINQTVLDAITAQGTVIDPAAAFVGVSAFTNGVDTRTRGVELSVNYATELPNARIDWSLAANYNRTTITHNRLGDNLFGPTAQSNLETASPRFKAVLGALVTHGPISLNVRETVYGKSSTLASPSGTAPFYRATVTKAAITDLELAYESDAGLRLAIGANNLFDKRPPNASSVPGSVGTPTAGPQSILGVEMYDAPLVIAPYGFNGGYYYIRAGVRF